MTPAVKTPVVRRLPKWSELKGLVPSGPVRWSATERRLSAALTVGDLRALARRRVPRPVFDYVDGASATEYGLARTRALFRGLEFHPQVLQDVAEVDTTASVLGAPSALPVAFSPTGLTRLMHHEGERAIARVAQRWGIPYAVATMSAVSIEDVAAEAPDGRHFFQLYLWKDRGASQALVERAAAAGYEALVVTVDVPVPALRPRDARNGFSIPPALTLKTFARIARHPAWGLNVLTTEPLAFSNLAQFTGSPFELVTEVFDASATLAELEWLRSIWPGRLVVKGVLRPDDAVRVAGAGADAIVVSTHGGRQLDGAVPPLRVLPDIRDAVGESIQVWLDSGILSGADIVAAIALGADTTMVGRAYLYGLMAGGEHGVDRAMQILDADIRRTMALLGVQKLSQLNASHVRLP